MHYKLPPLHCRLCKFLLNDDKFKKEYRNSYVCVLESKPTTKYVDACDDFMISKWQLVEFLDKELSSIKKLLTDIISRGVKI